MSANQVARKILRFVFLDPVFPNVVELREWVIVLLGGTACVIAGLIVIGPIVSFIIHIAETAGQ